MSGAGELWDACVCFPHLQEHPCASPTPGEPDGFCIKQALWA